jgi:AGZA family xanthine/uracil permease-like MFS transporter
VNDFRLPWFVKGDIDGFFGLWMDNLVQLLLIISLLKGVLGFPDSLIFGQVLPGAALSILGGNLFYAWQARRLAEREGREDVTALPYGINTVSLFAFVFFVMLPVKIATGSAEAAWRAGIAACLVSGLIETGGSFVAGWVRRAAPRAALLAALAGIAVTFISMDFALKIWERPLVAMAPLAIIFLQYFAKIRFPLGLPGGLVAVVAGAAVSAAIYGFPGGVPSPVGVALPAPVVGVLAGMVSSPLLWDFLAISVPMGLMTLVGSLMNLESAEAAGDRFDTRSSLAVNGAGSILAAVFGSCFPTTLYIGHPGWKGLGARSGYAVLNGAAVVLLCLTGSIGALASIVPEEAVIAILLWIGIIMVGQAFSATPARHAPAVALGFIPAVAAWGLLMSQTAFRTAGTSLHKLGAAAFGVPGSHLGGMIALERGFIFTSLILAAMAAALIDRRLLRAAGWAGAAALLAWFGVIHAWEVTPGGLVSPFGWAKAPAVAGGYLVMAGLFSLFALGGHGVSGDPGGGATAGDETGEDAGARGDGE